MHVRVTYNRLYLPNVNQSEYAWEGKMVFSNLEKAIKEFCRWNTVSPTIWAYAITKVEPTTDPVECW